MPVFQNRPANEQVLLNKFRTEVLENEAASRTLKSLQPETQEKYLYQIRRYISHCANKGWIILCNLFFGKRIN